MSEMKIFTLTRSNGPRVRFEGVHLGGDEGDVTGDHRRLDVDIYRTKGGRLIARMTFITRWQHERGATLVLVEDDGVSIREDMLDALTLSFSGEKWFDRERLGEIVTSALKEADALDVERVD
ncbi:hypothetical protein G3576_30735 [Roseomonas stagni]|uniref:Uncharacterized protein n=1 Tax=Falsiroseomonas algicola TaxID=2716930 RepID=A0A6M1LY20_9PROT|nr:hypothetical protein [Falsiroseomonas algicola]NGM24394.1 hypothetical protein [Falsiroseomonas algicola]